MTRADDTEATAALFVIRSEEAGWSIADQEALDSWLDESIAHRAAYWRLQQGWREADRIAALGWERAARVQIPKRLWQMAVAACLVLMVGVDMPAPRMDSVENVPVLRFDTPVGGHRVVPLADGSLIELNTATLMKTAVSSKHREVWLDRGEAFFEVAHAEGRPFLIHAGNRTISVLGTKFSVRRDSDEITVSVLEGRVKLAGASSQTQAPAAILTAGDIAIAKGKSTLLEAESEERVRAALSWRSGILDFDNSTLTEAAREFNRYNRAQIVIVDPDAAQIRISGEFQVSNVDAFVRLLRDAYGFRIRSTPQVLAISS